MSFGKIGVAGCGRMGHPMLAALRRAGFDAHGFDICEVAGDVTTDAKSFAKDLTILFSVVRDIPQTEALLFDTQALSTCPSLNTLIICSTLSPNYITELRQRLPANIALIDAPMSGAQIAAKQARLSFMLGGEARLLDQLQPLFSAMGSSFHRMGGLGTGMSAKVLNNLLAASNTAMTRLVLDWAKGFDLSETALLGLIDASSGQNWFASNFDTIEFAQDGYAIDNTIGILKKDVLSALDSLPAGPGTELPKAVLKVIETLKAKA